MTIKIHNSIPLAEEMDGNMVFSLGEILATFGNKQK